jgi:hypothetical protein
VDGDFTAAGGRVYERGGSVKTSVLGSWYEDVFTRTLANDNGAAFALNPAGQSAQGIRPRTLEQEHVGALALDTCIAEETRAFALFNPVRCDQGDRDALSGGPGHEDLAGLGFGRSNNLVRDTPCLRDRGEDLFCEIIIACTVSSSENS